VAALVSNWVGDPIPFELIFRCWVTTIDFKFPSANEVINRAVEVPTYYYPLGAPTTYYKLPVNVLSPACGYKIEWEVKVTSDIGASL
jgi:hypothetical protein